MTSAKYIGMDVCTRKQFQSVPFLEAFLVMASGFLRRRRFLGLEEFLKGDASKSEQVSAAQTSKAEPPKPEPKREAPSLLRKLFS